MSFLNCCILICFKLYWVTLVHLLFFLLFVILSVWLLLLLRMAFFYRIVEEKKLCFNIWHNLNVEIISTINVKTITLKNLVQKIISHLHFEKDPPLYHTFTPNLLDPRRQIKFTFPLKKERLWTMDLHHGKHPLPPSIWQIVLKCTQTSESIISQLWRTQSKSYGLDKLSITPEFTVYIRVS